MCRLCYVSALLVALCTFTTGQNNLPWKEPGMSPWTTLDENQKEIQWVGDDPSYGLKQRSCYSYHGHVEGAAGKTWSKVNCTAPFDNVCIMISGHAEMTDYNFKKSYQRGCHFTCPCPIQQPWVEWSRNHGGLNKQQRFEGAVFRHWEKTCELPHPPKNYDLGSTTLTWPQSHPMKIRCCKKHWDWIGHPNDTMKHPTRPTFRKDVNRTVDLRIGYFGTEQPIAQPPLMLQEDWVKEAAEDCNGWGSTLSDGEGGLIANEAYPAI